MPEQMRGYEPKFEAGRAYLELAEMAGGLTVLAGVDPCVLDGIAKISAVKPKTKRYEDLVEHNAALVLALRDTQFRSSEQLQRRFRETYDRAESLAYPAAVGYRDLCQRLHGVTSSFHLESMTLAQMRLLDELVVADEGADILHRMLLDKLEIARRATDEQLIRRLAQVFETFVEAWAYRRLRNCLSVSKIQESSDDPRPDFQCELNGREFFVEVKAPDVVDGDLHHEELMRTSTEAQIDLDNQLRSGERIAMAVHTVDPFRKLSDQHYDATDLTAAIATLRDRARNLFRVRQFSSGPTFALMCIDRYPIPGNRRAILPEYRLGGVWARSGRDRQSGVIWQAGFGQAGTVIYNLHSPDRVLTGTPFLLDPGVAFIAMAEMHSGAPAGTTECWGLLDRERPQPQGWSVGDCEAVLNAVCDVWNDGGDSRPKYQDAPGAK
jgi:hypothetical protein